MQYNIPPPPPFHEMNFPPPLPYGMFPQPPPFVLGSHAQQTSYPPISHTFMPNYSSINQYPQAVPYFLARQPPPPCSPMPTSNTHPQFNQISGSYSSHKSTSKRPLPIKSSIKNYSSSSSSAKTEYKKSYQHSTYEDDSITTPDEYSSLTPEEIIENEKKTWTRCAPADLYYARDLENPKLMRGTEKLKATIDQFRIKLLERGDNARTMQPKFDYPPRKTRRHSTQCSGSCKDKSKKTCDSDSSTSDSSSEEEDEVDLVLQELERKKQHPSRLHPELWFNDPGEMNDGPLCRCR
jgi:ribonuclease-3